MTSFHLQFFGYDLVELGFTAGITTTATQRSYFGSTMDEVKTLAGFWGPRLAVDVNPTFSLLADLRIIGTDKPTAAAYLATRARF